jgi:hypothetical protein
MRVISTMNRDTDCMVTTFGLNGSGPCCKSTPSLHREAETSSFCALGTIALDASGSPESLHNKTRDIAFVYHKERTRCLIKSLGC